MPTDTALLVAGQGGSPLSYDVPNAQEIVVLAARAVVDGSGAASAYLPVVQIVSDAGVILAEAITDTTVAAGASAQVSWFPRVGAAAAAAPGGGGAAYALADNFQSFSTFTVPDNVATPITFPTFFTSDSDIFGTSLNGAVIPHNQPNDDTLLLLGDGVFKVSMGVTWSGLNFPRYTIITDVGGPDAIDMHGSTPVSDFSSATSSTSSRSWWVDNATYIVQTGQTTRLQFQAYQNTGSDQHISSANFAATYWTFAGFANELSY